MRKDESALHFAWIGLSFTLSASAVAQPLQSDANAAVAKEAPLFASPEPAGDEDDSAKATRMPKPHTDQEREPALPEGMTLDEVLTRTAQTPPDHFPDAINDDRMLFFILWDQLEYRVDAKAAPDVLGWEANLWVGGDFNRLAIKPEGKAVLEKERSVESETDVVYSRLLAPFWSLQAGAQYANKWQDGGEYDDRWSGAIALQGLAPGKFEVDATGYVSEKADVTSVLEVEYDWRITQRFVAQPRAELTVAFQDIQERNMGAGLTNVVTGLRFRYEIKRELAPYLGIRYEASVFESADRARGAGASPQRFFVLAGIRAAGI